MDYSLICVVGWKGVEKIGFVYLSGFFFFAEHLFALYGFVVSAAHI